MTTNQPNAEQSQLSKSLGNFFVLFAILGVVSGAIHLFSILSNGLTSVRLADALFNTLIGVWAFVCSRVLAKGNRIIILLHTGTIVASMVYALAIGRGLNFVFIVVNAAILVGLVLLWRRGELE